MNEKEKQSPYKALDNARWEKGSKAQPGVKKSGLVMWKGSTARFKEEGDADWTDMEETGQAVATPSVPVFVTGGEIRV